MAKATLLDLPYEILREIAKQSPSLQDLVSLGTASRRCSLALLPIFYEYDARSYQPRALLWAATHGNMEVLKASLQAGADIDTQLAWRFPGKYLKKKNPFGQTPLMAAARYGHTEIVDFLLRQGANPRLINEYCVTALHCAAEGQHEDIVKLLLDRCPSLIYKQGDRQWGLPATWAAKDKTIFRFLLEHMDSEMCISSLEVALVNGHDEIVDWLVERGVEVDIGRLDHEERQTLDITCRDCTDGHVKNARFLLKAGANVDGKSDLAPPLQTVCSLNKAGAMEMASLLLDYGADVTGGVDGAYEKTPLREACLNGNVALARLLLSYTDEPADYYDEGDIIGLHEAACLSPSKECSDLIFEHFSLSQLDNSHGARFLRGACSSNNEDIVKMLLSSGANVNCLDHTGNHPVASAWKSGNQKLIKLLLHAGGDPNAQSKKGHSPLTSWEWPTGTDEHQTACLELFISLGADPVGMDNHGLTPLHGACYNGAVGCVRLLLEKYSADATAVSTSGQQPIHFAVKSGKVEIVKILVGKGANINAGYGTNRGQEGLHPIA